MVTQKQIAKQLGAVSAAYRRPKFVAPELRARILEAAQDLGYRHTNTGVLTFGIVTPNLHDFYYGSFYRDILFGILERCVALQIRAVFFEGRPESIDSVFDVNGLLLLGKPSSESLKWITERKMPTLQVGCPTMDPQIRSAHFENRESVQNLTQYALNLGHRNFAILNGEKSEDDLTWLGFYAGFQAAISAYPAATARIFQADYSDIFSVEIALTELTSAQSPVSIVMCANDYFAYYVYKFAEKYGIRIPDDISVTGFDGIEIPPFLAHPQPDLTTVFTDRKALGRASVTQLIQMIDHPKSASDLVMACQLRLGKSVQSLHLDGVARNGT